MTTTHLNDLFDQLEPEKGNKLDDKIQIEDSELNEIIQDYESNKKVLFSGRYPHNKFDAIKLKQYESKIITQFSKILNEELFGCTRRIHTGIFLNKAIQTSPDLNHLIFVDKYLYGISYLGYQNTKNITIQGTAHEVGDYMEKGNIIVNGNSSDIGNGMTSGTITINGNARSDIGHKMKGGVITVNGDILSEYAGSSIKNGTLKVNGRFRKIPNQLSFDGKLYHNGKLIRAYAIPILPKIYGEIEYRIKKHFSK